MASPTFDPLAPPDQVSFFTKLQHTFYSFDPNNAPTGLPEAGINAEGTSAQFDTLANTWGANLLNPAVRGVFPRTWDDFVTQVRTLGFGQSSAGDTTSGALFEGFYQDWQSIIQVSQGDLQGIDPAQLPSMFVEDFTQFLKTYTFQSDVDTQGNPGPNDGAAGPLSYFIEQWHKYMTVIAVNKTTLATGNYENVSAYQQIFQAFFPNGTEAEFEAMRNELVDEMRKSKEYFLPSQMLSQWYAKCQNAYLESQLGAFSVYGTDSDLMTIINDVFDLAVQMIGTLQNIAAAVAQRLNFLTQYQKAYTELMAKIPVFTKGDGSPFGGTNDKAASARQELNPKNQVLSQNLQSFRDQLSDQAKAVQSTVNQLNDQVNQQSSLADSILQEMSTILQGIYR